MSNEKHEPDWEWSFCLECKLTYTSAIKTGNELKKTNKRWPIDCQKSRSPVYLDCLYITCRLSMLEDIFSTAHAQYTRFRVHLEKPQHWKSALKPVFLFTEKAKFVPSLEKLTNFNYCSGRATFRRRQIQESEFTGICILQRPFSPKLQHPAARQLKTTWR